MTENDWDILYKWNTDSEVLYYSEGDDVDAYSIDMIKKIYRSVSQNACCFIIEYKDNPIGECWIQKMNLDYIIKKYPDKKLRRIDLMIGEKDYWGKGIGTKVIEKLTAFGFKKLNTDIIFAVVEDYNIRNKKAFEKVGFKETGRRKTEGEKGKYEIEMSIKSEKYLDI